MRDLDIGADRRRQLQYVGFQRAGADDVEGHAAHAAGPDEIEDILLRFQPADEDDGVIDGLALRLSPEDFRVDVGRSDEDPFALPRSVPNAVRSRLRRHRNQIRK